MNDSSYDVLIIGGGWAGLTLARQLKLNKADIKIQLLEASTEFKSKVGEATVEMTGHYFMKQLGLVNYLYNRQLPKNGLRFMFDSPEHDLNVYEMSEHGTTSIPPHPAFQIDRARFESDLMSMNRDAGIEILQGAKVTDISIGENDTLSTASFTYNEKDQSTSAKWIVDCSGRHRLSRKHTKLHRQENVPENFAAWGRFKNIQDIDAMGSEEWRKKAFGRFLSTIHFTGDGYWVWFIPLAGGYTSVGIVGENHKFESKPTKKDSFLAFLNQHKSIANLLEGSELMDFEAWGQLAYRADEFIFKDRWATSGFASMFLDPLFSGGGDMIALFNDHICDQILSDLSEPNTALANQRLQEQLPVCNQIVKEFYQGLYAHVAVVYPIIDCAELTNALAAYNTSAYFVEIAWDYMAGNYLDHDYWKRKSYLRRGYMAMELMLQRQVLATREVLLDENRYYHRNTEGFFESGADHYKYFVYQMGEHGRDGWRIDLRIKMFTEVFLRVTQAKLNLPKLASRMVVQQCFTFVDVLKNPLFGKQNLPELLEKLSNKLSDLVSEQLERPVMIKVNEDSFHTDEVSIIPNELTDEERNKAEKLAKALWGQTQEFIAMPSMVPVFLNFAREQPDDIMDSIIDQRKVFDPRSEKFLSKENAHKQNTVNEVEAIA